jgi:hypothetical protein|tara:strand:- start:20477 stop:20740 length:264 start_codon:yes stop_codon:yes gene_type:complete
MQKLLIKYRFQNYPYLVADGLGEFYLLPHQPKKYYKPFRKMNRVLNNGVTEGLRINRKFVSLNQLRKHAYVSKEVIIVEERNIFLPF